MLETAALAAVHRMAVWAMRVESGSPVGRPVQGLGEGAGGQGHGGSTAAGVKHLDSGVVSRAAGQFGCGGGEKILEHCLVFGLSSRGDEILPSQQLYAASVICVL